jgi:RNA polymerase sigma-70 factor (ECF subfamily)
LRSHKEITEQSFELVFRANYQLLCNYAYTFVQDRDEAEEIVQSVFLTFWEKRQSVQVQQSEKAYLLSMVRNASLNAVKHEKVKLKYGKNTMTKEEPSAAMTFSDELEQRITLGLNRLPEQCRLVFQMSRMEDMKHKDIAGQLNISVKTVENQIGKAMRLMREHLREYLVMVLVWLTTNARF